MEAVKPNAWQRKKTRRCLRLIDKFLATAEDEELAPDERARKYYSFCDNLVQALRSLGKESLAVLVEAFYWRVGEVDAKQDSESNSEVGADLSDDKQDDFGEKEEDDGEDLDEHAAGGTEVDDYRLDVDYDASDNKMESSEEHDDSDDEDESSDNDSPDDGSSDDDSDDEDEDDDDEDRFSKFERLVASYLDEYSDELTQKIR